MSFNSSESAYGLTPEDFVQLKSIGITAGEVNRQLERLPQGFPPLHIDRPALLGDGVKQLAQNELEALGKCYQQAIIDGIEIYKFVPASGAASRMFKNLLAYLNGDQGHYSEVRKFCHNIHRFAFAGQLEASCPDLETLIQNKQYHSILEQLLTADGLNYQQLPKAFLPIHRGSETPKTVLEEHLIEAALYANTSGKVQLHFTVAAKHLELFKRSIDALSSGYQQRSGLEYRISFSEQQPSTDTIAVDQHNIPVRDSNGQLLMRPGGHGALLANLDAIDADIIFIKNVDNVAPDPLKPLMVTYKNALAGLLLKHQSRVFQYIKQLKEDPADTVLEEAFDFLGKLGCQIGEGYRQLSAKSKIEYLVQKLNRPLRVCSVIQTEKPTGGGPFWVQSKSGACNLQIIENAQLENSHADIVSKAQFVHITDMVCAVKNWTGEKFRLSEFIDPEAGIVTEKSYAGKKIKALEHPGLWNGSMAHWNTILVAVPDSIFHPVKSVWDLWE